MEKAVSCAKQEVEKSFFKNLPDRARIMSERIYVIGDKLTHPEEFGDTLGKLVAAVIECYKVKITYVKLGGQTSQRFIYPLGIVSKRNVWYVIAWAPSRNDYRTFRMDQVLDVIPYRDSIFPYPNGFSVAEHIGNSWGVYCDDPVQLVRLRFSPAVTNRIKKLSYHPSQKIVAEDPQGLIVEYEVCGFKELQSWVLQWGPEVEVLHPPELREQVRERARLVLKKYQRHTRRQSRVGT